MSSDHEIRRQRLDAVREAFWAATPSDSTDCKVLCEMLVAERLVAQATPVHAKLVFMMLPATVVASMLCWGLGDAEVRDEVDTFLVLNRQSILDRLRAVPQVA